MYILIGGAWPYANGSLHIGHIAGLLPGDVLARYHRQKGDTVSYVSGSDCYGTPITLLAKKENRSPRYVSDYYHEEFCRCFEQLGFSYDYYGKTSSLEHGEFVREFHERLYRSDSVEEKITEQAYCPYCKQFLPDRFVNGICPACGEQARGDQCDGCGAVFDSIDLQDPVCAECHGGVERRPTKHLYLKLSDFAEEIEACIRPEVWRQNAVDFTRRYIREGLRDRALTRDISWGVKVPREGYGDKRIYIWAENVLGYLSSCYLHCQERGENFDNFWKGEDTFHYYVHGKDNIPFHSIILPALLLAEGEGRHLPDAIISSEYMTLDGRKISTSRNHAVWINDLLETYSPDAIRYFFLSNAPEKRDADFSYREFIHANNGELLGVYGNFVNRTLVFIQKYYDSVVPQGLPDEEIQEKLAKLYVDTAARIERGALKEALLQIFDAVRFANKYFDIEQPWISRTAEPASCENTLFNCVQMIANFCVLLAPFLPFSSQKITGWLGLDDQWCMKDVPAGRRTGTPRILFERILM